MKVEFLEEQKISPKPAKIGVKPVGNPHAAADGKITRPLTAVVTAPGKKPVGSTPIGTSSGAGKVGLTKPAGIAARSDSKESSKSK